jgi:hypothetical protein
MVLPSCRCKSVELILSRGKQKVAAKRANWLAGEYVQATIHQLLTSFTRIKLGYVSEYDMTMVSEIREHSTTSSSSLSRLSNFVLKTRATSGIVSAAHTFLSKLNVRCYRCFGCRPWRDSSRSVHSPFRLTKQRDQITAGTCFFLKVYLSAES